MDVDILETKDSLIIYLAHVCLAVSCADSQSVDFRAACHQQSKNVALASNFMNRAGEGGLRTCCIKQSLFKFAMHAGQGCKITCFIEVRGEAAKAINIFPSSPFESSGDGFLSPALYNILKLLVYDNLRLSSHNSFQFFFSAIYLGSCIFFFKHRGSCKTG